MQPSKQFCKRQIERMEGLPYYATIGTHGFTELVNALVDSAASDDIARAAVDAILSDTSRASSPETNRVPSPGELRVWVQAQAPPPLDDQRPARQFCGGCESGWVRATESARGFVYEGVGRCVCQGGTFKPAANRHEVLQ